MTDLTKPLVHRTKSEAIECAGVEMALRGYAVSPLRGIGVSGWKEGPKDASRRISVRVLVGRLSSSSAESVRVIGSVSGEEPIEETIHSELHNEAEAIVVACG